MLATVYFFHHTYSCEYVFVAFVFEVVFISFWPLEPFASAVFYGYRPAPGVLAWGYSSAHLPRSLLFSAEKEVLLALLQPITNQPAIGFWQFFHVSLLVQSITFGQARTRQCRYVCLVGK